MCEFVASIQDIIFQGLQDFAYTCHSEYISKSTVIGTIIIVY